MTYPDKENTLSLLGDWRDNHTRVNSLMDGVKITIGLDPNGPMFDTVWRLFDAYTETLSVEVGDFDGWLSWYHMDDGMGSIGMAAGYDKNAKPIKTLDDLYGLIQESRKRAGL